MIDLRSDTVTRPTPAMRRAMADAPLGDDVYGEDPTVNALEQRTAELLGKDAAIFMPSGTMTNQVALRSHTEGGDAILTDINAHIFRLEGGAPGGVSGLMIRPLMGRNGIFSADDVAAAARRPHRFMPVTVMPLPRLVCLENTHNIGGGTIWPIETVQEVAKTTRAHSMPVHLDGARLWHACVATGISEADYAAPFDSISVCFSKGLGAPVGSALVGNTAFIDRARRFRTMVGGAMRQAGTIAAGALHALEHHRARLAEDHVKARRLAEGLARLPGIAIDPTEVETNIVRFRLTEMEASTFAERCHQDGVFLLPGGPDTLRAVTHLDVSEWDIDQALAIIEAVVAKPLT